MSMKNSNDTIGNRTRDLPVCSTVPQTTAPPSTSDVQSKTREKISDTDIKNFKQSVLRKVCAFVFLSVNLYRH
jgi:hypothetical protein